MKRIFSIALFAIAASLLAGCDPNVKPAANNAANTTNANAGNANSNASKPMAAAPSKEALMELENKAFDAWKNGDGKYFEGLLMDNFVGFMEGQRFSKGDEVKMIGGEKCDIKSMNFSDANVTPVGPDAAVLTTKATVDGTCGGKKIPSPTASASLYVRVGGEWKAAYHNETPVVDPKAPPSAPAAAKKEDQKKETAAPTSDALTDALMAVEKKGWDGWRTQDAKALQEVTTPEFGFVDVFGHPTFTQAEVIKMWTTGKCEIKSAGPTDGKATSITPTVAILTYKGVADGTCEGQKLKDLWGTTIAIKDGDTWKAAYIFEAPAA